MNTQKVKLRNGRNALQGNCSVCGKRLSKIISG
ncbi:MAG TPA: DUF5679 domain-containing protein [Thermodesulfovibrionia bacterium]|nr:DUF5679 domain-containing protein [Thermodesulfovibrionia bacterium]